jgi:hypothetical protein
MTLTLRRTVFLDGERRSDDYEVRQEGRTSSFLKKRHNEAKRRSFFQV